MGGWESKSKWERQKKHGEERKGDLKTIEFRGALAVRGASVFAVVSENHNSEQWLQ